MPWGSFGPCPRVGAPRPKRGLDLMSPGHNTIVCTPLVHKCLTYPLEHWTLRRYKVFLTKTCLECCKINLINLVLLLSVLTLEASHLGSPPLF